MLLFCVNSFLNAVMVSASHCKQCQGLDQKDITEIRVLWQLLCNCFHTNETFLKGEACGNEFNCSDTPLWEGKCCSGVAAAVDPAFAKTL